MKTFISLLLLSTFLFGCSQPEVPEENTYPSVMEAAVLEENGASLLVTPVKDGKIENEKDLYTVPKGESKAKVDDIVQIVYDGSIMESYPMQLGNVTRVEVTGTLE